MKHLKFIIAGLAAICLLNSCGGSKNATTPSGYTKGTKSTAWGTEIELNECQLLAEESPATRAYGEGTNHRLSFAKTYAEGQARAALARAVSSYITAASKEAGLNWNQYAGNDTEGQSATDEGSKGDLEVQQIAQEVIANTVVIKTNQYMQPNRQYHVFVCVEYQGGASEMAEQITKKLEQMVPDEERIKMEYQFQKFHEEIQKELEKQNKR